jgi:phospholipase C
MSPQSSSTALALLQNIQHFVVLMLENRSFDHLFGFLNSQDSRIAGLSGNESNPTNPAVPGSPTVQVSRATAFAMPFDPAHEFLDVQYQLYAPSGAPADPAAMQGFLGSAVAAAPSASDAPLVMQCFQSDQLPVLSTLARQFALLNYYYSSLPGPTWPNRFFIHAATSGGLTDSPGTAQIVDGFSFQNGTIYDALSRAGKNWRIYHDGLPQSAGIASLRGAYADPFTNNFREMSFFQQDVAANNLPEFTFIEPNYDTGNNYQNGNSMHPLNDIRKGEQLVKLVYETLRQSNFWVGTMLIINFDEHGGFYDHVPPPATVATGDDATYANSAHPFSFQRLGVRVPCIVVSPYTQPGTIIGATPEDPTTIFDHASVLATLEERFQLPSLTQRDKSANTLEAALNVSKPRMTAADAPTSLPQPAPDSAVTAPPAPAPTAATASAAAASPAAPLSANQKSILDLALACDLKASPESQRAAVIQQHQQVNNQADADAYIRSVENKIHSRRHTHLGSAPGGAK